MCYGLFRSVTCIAFRDVGLATDRPIYVYMYLLCVLFYLCCLPACTAPACGCGAWGMDAILFDRFPLKKSAECAEMFTHGFLGLLSAHLDRSLAPTVSKMSGDSSARRSLRGREAVRPRFRCRSAESRAPGRINRHFT